jgi:hypothetical protein
LSQFSVTLGSRPGDRVGHRLAERLGSFSRDIATELEERTARLKRVEERVRGLILMQAEGDRSPMVGQMRADFEAQAQAERAAVEGASVASRRPHPSPTRRPLPCACTTMP